MRRLPMGYRWSMVGNSDIIEASYVCDELVFANLAPSLNDLAVDGTLNTTNQANLAVHYVEPTVT